jgi:hypothetical protein
VTNKYRNATDLHVSGKLEHYRDFSFRLAIHNQIIKCTMNVSNMSEREVFASKPNIMCMHAI